MWRRLLYILPLILSTASIKVPIDNEEESTSTVTTENTAQDDQTYYVPEDTSIDSYLIPPDPHKPDEELAGVLVTPATYLLPPSPEQEPDNYYAPTEPGDQSEWYPIAQNNVQSQNQQPEPLPIFIANDNHHRKGQVQEAQRIILPVPSTHLEPPTVDAPNDYLISTPSAELQLPLEEIDHSFRVPLPIKNYQTYREPKKAKNVYPNDLPLNYRLKPEEPTLAVHLTPPKAEFSKYKTPTKLYPKKVSGGFKPVPIPIAQFAEDPLETPRAKPEKYFKPDASAENVYLSPLDEKKIYLYQNSEQKRKSKGENQAIKQQLGEITVAETNVERNPTEQQASESNHRYPGQNAYPAPLRQASPVASQNANTAPAPDDRTEFRMHGMKGPHSYQFGYDTGKGKNRQFRYEERDNEGIVHGHYGYMDKHGKLRVVNYSAHPEHGFHAEAPVDKE